MKNKPLVLFSVLVVVVIAVVLTVNRNRGPAEPTTAPSPSTVTASPGTDSGLGNPTTAGQGRDAQTISGLKSKDPEQQARAESQRSSLIEAAQTGEHLERRSTLVRAAPFDRVAYERDPEAYLRVIEPGRIFQSAKPGSGVRSLAIVGDAERTMPARSSITLAVRGEPLAPVTFHSSDGGQFENRLSTITVRANAQGEAQARYVATAGTYADVHIMASSPMTSGRVLFVIDVEDPDMMPEQIAKEGEEK
jgi:hypothetical protein